MEKEKGMTERERESARGDGGAMVAARRGEARRGEARRGEARLVRTGGGGSVADGRLGRYGRSGGRRRRGEAGRRWARVGCGQGGKDGATAWTGNERAQPRAGR